MTRQGLLQGAAVAGAVGVGTVTRPGLGLAVLLAVVVGTVLAREVAGAVVRGHRAGMARLRAAGALS